MNRTRSAALVVAVIALSCGPRRIATPSPGQDTFVLLADSQNGAVGHAIVTTKSGTVELTQEREATRVTSNGAAAATVLDAAEVQTAFGDTLNALPPAPSVFVLHFQFDSDELTAEARAVVPEVLRLVRERPVPDVIIVGHTDTTGDRTSNFALGLKRATAVRSILIQAGLDASAIEMMSHGETDLLVPTADDTFEPRNRRVEIAVR